MRPSEHRELISEKISYEHRGKGVALGAFLNFLKKDESLSEIQVAAMKEEVRNETAKACIRDLRLEWQADMIKAHFFRYCEDYATGGLTHEELLKLYRKALTELNNLRYEDHQD